MTSSHTVRHHRKGPWHSGDALFARGVGRIVPHAELVALQQTREVEEELRLGQILAETRTPPCHRRRRKGRA